MRDWTLLTTQTSKKVKSEKRTQRTHLTFQEQLKEQDVAYKEEIT